MIRLMTKSLRSTSTIKSIRNTKNIRRSIKSITQADLGARIDHIDQEMRKTEENSIHLSPVSHLNRRVVLHDMEEAVFLRILLKHNQAQVFQMDQIPERNKRGPLHL